MNVHDAYRILSDYQLLNNGRGIDEIFSIMDKYGRLSPYLNGQSKIPLISRIANVLDACATIENKMIEDSDRVLDFRNILGDDEFSRKYREFLDEEDKRIIAQVGKPLPPAPEIDNHPAVLQVYEKYKAKSIGKKCNALEKARGFKQGSTRIHMRGDWREPKWKLKQTKLRALAYIFLIEEGLVDVQLC